MVPCHVCFATEDAKIVQYALAVDAAQASNDNLVMKYKLVSRFPQPPTVFRAARPGAVAVGRLAEAT